MTFRSLFVEKHGGRAAAMEPHVTGRAYAILGALDAHTWPLPLKTFAEMNGLSIDWVDNCWIRVCVNGTQLKAFLAAGDGKLGDRANMGDSNWFVINEEEF